MSTQQVFHKNYIKDSPFRGILEVLFHNEMQLSWVKITTALNIWKNMKYDEKLHTPTSTILELKCLNIRSLLIPDINNESQ
jgi:hypothetical protein